MRLDSGFNSSLVNTNLVLRLEVMKEVTYENSVHSEVREREYKFQIDS